MLEAPSCQSCGENLGLYGDEGRVASEEGTLRIVRVEGPIEETLGEGAKRRAGDEGALETGVVGIETGGMGNWDKDSTLLIVLSAMPETEVSRDGVRRWLCERKPDKFPFMGGNERQSLSMLYVSCYTSLPHHDGRTKECIGMMTGGMV